LFLGQTAFEILQIKVGFVLHLIIEFSQLAVAFEASLSPVDVNFLPSAQVILFQVRVGFLGLFGFCEAHKGKRFLNLRVHLDQDAGDGAEGTHLSFDQGDKFRLTQGGEVFQINICLYVLSVVTFFEGHDVQVFAVNLEFSPFLLVETLLHGLLVFKLDITVASAAFRLIENVQFGRKDFSELNKIVFKLGRGDRVGDVFNKKVGFGGQGLDIFFEGNAQTVLQDNLVVDCLAGFFGVRLLVKGHEGEASGFLVHIARNLQGEDLPVLS